MIRKFLNKLLTVSSPHYGFVTLTATILLMFLYLYFIHDYFPAYDFTRGTPVSLFGRILPDAVLSSQLLYNSLIALTVSLALLWLGHVWIPFSSWMTCLSYIVTTSIYLENISHMADHTHNIIAVFLLIHALWYQFYGRQIVNGIQQRNILSQKVFPYWVYLLQLVYIGTAYSFAGTQKLLYSGFGWVNGVSLQLWASIWGNPNFPLTNMIIHHRDLAVTLQALVIFFESTAVLGIFFKRFRIVSAIGLLSFHIFNELLFGFLFYANMILLALVYLPVYERLQKQCNPPESL